ncbi:MAG: pilus assembly protein PilM [Tepidisphaeraceae bacterium]|jgi:Tfp pilus assembly PilM family ATPase
MFGFVQSIFAPPAYPIGVDFGTDALRMAQVQIDDGDFRLLAAAVAEIPPNVRGDPEARLGFFAEHARHLLNTGKFRGRRAVLGLPPSVVHTQRLALSPMDEKLIPEAINACAKQKQEREQKVKQEQKVKLELKLPFDPARALLRHAVVGQTRDADDPRLHVIVMAADTQWINQFIAAARQARLDVVAMNMQPLALLDCFANVYRRTAEQQSVRMYVDIGSSGTRAFIGQGTHLLFARNLAVGGDHLTRAVADSLAISFQDARTLRIKLCAGAGAGANSGRVEMVCRQALEELIQDLDGCRREHELAFPDLAISRLIFIGGEARHEGLCQHIAEKLKLPGQTGDCLCRMVRNSRIGIESAIDRRHPQPAWSAAIGLSMGPGSAD